jgi:FOG: Glucan-binding domain (YG repeat)
MQYIELSLDMLYMLKEKDFHSLLHVEEKDFGNELVEDAGEYYILKPSRKKVTEEHTEIGGKYYSPILSGGIKEMARNDTPFIDFLLMMDDEILDKIVAR